MKLCSSNKPSGGLILAALGFVQQVAVVSLAVEFAPMTLRGYSATQTGSLQSRLLDKCCQSGRQLVSEHSSNDRTTSSCKLNARQALGLRTGSPVDAGSASPEVQAADAMLARDQTFGEQCELVAESCCMSIHRARNCDSGKQFAKEGASCMDVELSKETTIATESFNDCCMACSLGVLAARTNTPNETSSADINGLVRGGHTSGRLNPTPTATSLNSRCKLLSPLASSMSGQLYEQTYLECCLENLPRQSGALVEPGTTVDCQSISNPCSQRCTAKQSPFETDKCACFAGYTLAPDGYTCLDVDECKTGAHSCNRNSEVCDNTRGGFRCLARRQTDMLQVLATPLAAMVPRQSARMAAYLDADRIELEAGRSLTGSRLQEVESTKPRRVSSLLVASPMRTGSAPREEVSETSSEISSSEFSSLRLCPVGSRWNAEKARCQQVLTAASLLARR